MSMKEDTVSDVYDTSAPIRALNDHNCFGCGALNPGGLHLHFYARPGGGVWAPFVPTRAFEGYGGMIHGGIISTLLDEIMAWSLYRQEIWAVTATMSTRFRKPVEVDVPVRLVGWVERDRGRVLEVRGEVRRQVDDVLLAEASATFMRVPESQAAAWNERYLTGPDNTARGE
jgi:acyl-coenzyme A thioesterase PaaI-like protein